MTSQGRPARAKHAAQNIVIDIGSSPEPAGPGPIKLASRSRTTVAQTNAMGKGKAKTKSNKRTGKVIMGPVIELTDSESDFEEPGPSVPKGHNHTNDQAQAGPSRLKPKPFPMIIAQRSNTTLAALPAASSLENIPIASGSGSQKKRKAPPTPTLFLPSQSDEENEPPLVDVGAIPNEKGEMAEPDVNGLVRDDEWDLEMDQYLQQFYEEDRRVRQRLDTPVPDVHAPFTAPVPHPQIPDRDQVVPPVPQPIPQPALTPAEPLAQAPPAHVGEPVIQVEPEPEPEPQGDPTDRTIAQILEIIPDVEPDYLRGLVETHLPSFDAQTTEHILGLLFENGEYPRVDKSKGKRKATDQDDAVNRPQKKMKVDYASKERVVASPVYHEFALIHLQISFPLIPKPFLRRTLEQNNGLYVLTHFAVAALQKPYPDATEDPNRFLPYIPKTMRYNPAKDLRVHGRRSDKEFTEERIWLIEHLQDPNETKVGVVGAAIPGEPESSGKGKGKEKFTEEEDDAPLEDGTGIECQCCFSEYAFDKMVQCPEAHLFCSSCVSQYAATKLGEHNPSIICMHASGCALPFTESELRRILSPKLMNLYERVKQQKEIEAAGLEGLEECPFCEWKCVLEASNEEEKLFRCGNEVGGCGVVSCRICKKKDHLPKSCKEVEEDKVLDGRHAIEEAMTRALMRNCPKCNKAFVKETGCNKMTCPHCRTLSCYVCRQVIVGYQHFDQMPGQPSNSKSTGKCRLWDNVEERHAVEVRAAAEKAAAEYKRDHPEVSDEGIKVDLPAVPPPPPAPHAIPVNHIMPPNVLLRGVAPPAAYAPLRLGALPGLQLGDDARAQFHQGLQHMLPPPPRNPPAAPRRPAKQTREQRQRQLQQELQEAEARMQRLQQQRNAVEELRAFRARMDQQQAALAQQQEHIQAQQQALEIRLQQRGPQARRDPFWGQLPGLQAQQEAERQRAPERNAFAGVIEAERQALEGRIVGITQQHRHQHQQIVEAAANNVRQQTRAARAQQQQQQQLAAAAAARQAPGPFVVPGLVQPVHRLYEDALRRHNEERARRR